MIMKTLRGLVWGCFAVALSTTVQAKPDNVDGVNVPFGRIPQEIKDNKYPRVKKGVREQFSLILAKIVL